MADQRPTVVQTECDLFPASAIVRKEVAAAGFHYEGIPTDEPEAVVARAGYADAVVVSGFPADAAFIDQLQRCRIIARCGVGIDNVDVERARERGIVVTNVPDFCTVEVAEHTLALILACERKITLSDRALRAGSWLRYADLAPMRRLEGLTVGIVGFGRIGRLVAKLVQGIGMVAIAHDPYLESDPSGMGVPLLAIEELLPRADFLSLHLPLTQGTRPWLDAERLRHLPRGATVVNTARGGVIDEAALLAALEEGAVRAAGLDVFQGEPEVDVALISHPNVVATPHSAALSEESMSELFHAAAADVVRVLSDESPIHPVPLGVAT